MSYDFSTYIEWYDLDPMTCEAFRRLVVMPSVYQQMFSLVMMLVNVKAKGGDPYAKVLNEETVDGLLQGLYFGMPEGRDRMIVRGLKQLFALKDPFHDYLCSRVGMSIYCVNEYRSICQRISRDEDHKVVLMLIAITIAEGLNGAREYLLSVRSFDTESEWAYVKLAEAYRVKLSSNAWIESQLREELEKDLVEAKPEPEHGSRNDVRTGEGGMKMTEITW